MVLYKVCLWIRLIFLASSVDPSQNCSIKEHEYLAQTRGILGKWAREQVLPLLDPWGLSESLTLSCTQYIFIELIYVKYYLIFALILQIYRPLLVIGLEIQHAIIYTRRFFTNIYFYLIFQVKIPLHVQHILPSYL